MIMNTNFIIRKARSIVQKNEITDFPLKYSIYEKEISAVSFENSNETIAESGAKMLKEIIDTYFPSDNHVVNFFAKLYPQPDNRIVRYRGFWGLSKIKNISSILDKYEALIQVNPKKYFL
ncbi:hypothetical protein A1D23_13295 [Chelonobacter oris]|nr:hypothetical protein [Chelonobacter oris]